MTTVGQIEAATQKRVIDVLKRLGYSYLGNWKDRLENSNIEEPLLKGWLLRSGYEDAVIAKALFELGKAATVSGARDLYVANRATYELLRYGVNVKADVGDLSTHVELIDWKHPKKNDFQVAEEVTFAGEHVKRPDVVMYVNGIAVAVLELKRSTVSVSEGIRQNLDNQKKEFIREFFSTIQLVFAGNDTEGMHYGVIETPEKFFMKWKEPADDVANPLDRAVRQMLQKERFLGFIHDFIVFDAGIKKTCRHNQFFGVRKAQEFVKRHEGGIIWHTQGSGKSLVMVWLAKWIKEQITGSRVLLITDRRELDKQIEMVFKGVGENIHRTKSGADLVSALNANDPWLICSLIHKFGAAEEGDVDGYVEELKKVVPTGFEAKGDIFVFIDECHRTQSGKLREAMKSLLPHATVIGFTGTPLLRSDKQKRSIEVFGKYIDTYKYDEAVEDNVVLDLRYEARDIDITVTQQQKIDDWFELKTKNLTDIGKDRLKQQWATLKAVHSSSGRLNQIVRDIALDMGMIPRLAAGHGNALLVCDSIYNACRIYELFQSTDLKGKCAIVTSYEPSVAAIKGEETGEGESEKQLQYDVYREMLAGHFGEPEESAVTKIEQFEKDVTARFVNEPGKMKLLIVVDRLLTGFDAPPATYLYVDKPMRDHGLFQAICRVNRLDEDKEYGYIVDYRDLFGSLKEAVKDYTGDAFDGFDAEDIAGLLEDRLEKGRSRLENAREAVVALCAEVLAPRDTNAYAQFFCGGYGKDSEELKKREERRVTLYKLVGSLLSAYADIATEMHEAVFPTAETEAIRKDVEHYEKVRSEIRLISGDYIDLKMFDPQMRFLIDTFLRASETEVLSAFDELNLVDLIVQRGKAAVDALPIGIRSSEGAVAETIESNVRKLIIDSSSSNPKYFDRMSELLEAIVDQRKRQVLAYKDYLREIVRLTREARQPATANAYPPSLTTDALRALYDNLDKDVTLALLVDTAIRHAKLDDWRGHPLKVKKVLQAIKSEIPDEGRAAEVLELAMNQRDY